MKPWAMRSGANYDLELPMDAMAFRPAESWNTGKIVVAKDNVRHVLNGKLMADYTYGKQAYEVNGLNCRLFTG